MHARLGGRVGGPTLIIGCPGGALARPRGNADDSPGALPHHVRYRVSRAEKGTAEVETQDKVPVLDRHLPNFPRAAAPDHVDENIEPPVALYGALDELRRRLLFREITDHAEGCTAGAGDVCHRALEPSGIEIAEHEPRALLGQTAGNGLP